MSEPDWRVRFDARLPSHEIDAETAVTFVGAFAPLVESNRH